MKNDIPGAVVAALRAVAPGPWRVQLPARCLHETPCGSSFLAGQTKRRDWPSGCKELYKANICLQELLANPLCSLASCYISITIFVTNLDLSRTTLLLLIHVQKQKQVFASYLKGSGGSPLSRWKFLRPFAFQTKKHNIITILTIAACKY